MIIRELAASDRSQWLTLWDGYNSFYGRVGPTRLSPEITDTTWQRFFDPDEPVYARVAEMDGKLVGLGHYLFHRSTISIAPTCYLQDLFTSEGARGQGIATKLIERVCSEARTEGCGRVYWQTHETNARARKLYDHIAERSGFIVYRKSLSDS